MKKGSNPLLLPQIIKMKVASVGETKKGSNPLLLPQIIKMEVLVK